MDKETQKTIRKDFHESVNMAPKEIETWLKTEESRSVGQDSGDGESIGHKSGQRIIEIKNKKVEELTEEDYEHMKKVHSYVSRHMAQGPEQDKKDSPWRYSLMNWGHDPCKEEDC
jgi:hypothetical protein